MSFLRQARYLQSTFRQIQPVSRISSAPQLEIEQQREPPGSKDGQDGKCVTIRVPRDGYDVITADLKELLAVPEEHSSPKFWYNNGRWYAIFESAAAAKASLKADKQKLGVSPVEVSWYNGSKQNKRIHLALKDLDFFQRRVGELSHAVVVTGLPELARAGGTHEMITRLRQHFQGFNLAPQPVLVLAQGGLVSAASPTPQPAAWVRFTSSHEAAMAARRMDGTSLEGGAWEGQLLKVQWLGPWRG